MPTIKHILFPFDFSEPAFLAVPFVRAIARRYSAPASSVLRFASVERRLATKAVAKKLKSATQWIGDGKPPHRR